MIKKILALRETIYMDGFNAGFNRAFSLIADFIKKGVQEVTEYIKTKTYEEALAEVEKIAQERINALGDMVLKDKFLILNKKQELAKKLENAKSIDNKVEILKYASYLDILDWVLNDGRHSG